LRYSFKARFSSLERQDQKLFSVCVGEHLSATQSSNIEAEEHRLLEHCRDLLMKEAHLVTELAE